MVKKLKCDKCGKIIRTTFLGKIKGTYVKEKGKKKVICSECQKKIYS